MPIARLSTVNLFFERIGDHSLPLLILLHGATDTFRSGWKKQIEVFSHHFHVLGVDLRGHGHSDNPLNRLDLREMADDIAELIRYNAMDTQKVNVCGFSGGASTALFFAHRHVHLINKVVLVSNNLERDKSRLTTGFWNVERMKLEQPGWWQHMLKSHKHTDPATLMKWWEDEDAHRPNFSHNELSHVSVPTLVVGGDRDPIIPLDQTIKLFRALPNSQLAVFPNIAHGVPTQASEIFNKMVIKFLE